MKKIATFLILMTVLMTSIEGFSQDSEKHELIVQSIKSELEANFIKGMEIVRAYNSNNDENLKFQIIGMVWEFGLASKEVHERQEIVNYLLDMIEDDILVSEGQSIRFASAFSSGDFDEKAKGKLAAFPLTGQFDLQIMFLIGIADLREMIPELEKIAKEHNGDITSLSYHDHRKWVSSVVLARFGDQKMLDRVIQRVKDEEDITKRATELFADLAFTKQPKAFDVLRSYLKSTKRISRVKVGTPGTLEAKRAAEHFLTYIENFPDIIVNESTLPKIIMWADRQTKWLIK